MLHIDEFYPTPVRLLHKMLSGIKLEHINTILEPSAGKGDILDAIMEKLKVQQYGWHGGTKNLDIDAVEIDSNLRHILKGKSYRVIHDDFLSLQTYKTYDLIIMNPPFSAGDKHLLKALELQANGGKVICLLNAETIRNPHTNARKDLSRKLEEYNASIEFIAGAFAAAERQTAVEIALIKVDIPQAKRTSFIISGLKAEEYQHQAAAGTTGQVIHADFFQRIVAQYNHEVKAGIRIIDEWEALSPHMLTAFPKEGEKDSSPIIDLRIMGEDNKYRPLNLRNAYIRRVRAKYWETLFRSDEFSGRFTSNLRKEWHSQIENLCHYDFSLYNIEQIRMEIMQTMTKGVEETILALFEELSNKHHWYDEMSKNIHYFNGWKTNKSWKINKKVILPMYGVFDRWDGKFSSWRAFDKLTDIEKVFDYLDDGAAQEVALRPALDFAGKSGNTRKIETKYFYLTFYKKGTCHMEFRNAELLHKFNIFGSQRKNWLPPTYGKARYKDMSPEEKAVVDSFDGGEKEYEKILAKKNYFIPPAIGLPLIAC